MITNTKQYKRIQSLDIAPQGTCVLTCVHSLTSGKETIVTPAALAVLRMCSSCLGGWDAKELYHNSSCFGAADSNKRRLPTPRSV